MKTGVRIGGMSLRNRVLTASGTFGYGNEALDPADLARLGGIITKSLSLKPRPGNPPPRIVETPAGMLNSIGLANIGVRRFLEEKVPFLGTLDTAVIANVAAGSVDEYCAVVELLDAEEAIDGIEINVSCPNVRDGGLTFGTDAARTEEIARRVRERTRKPLIIKLTPNVARVAEFARAAEGAGADAVSLINTLIGMAVDVRTRRPLLSSITGGLSGPAVKPVALAKVFEASRAVSIPVIGIGGIASATDALEFLIVGASAVQVGTANFLDPAAGIRIAEGIERFCLDQGLADIAELVGSLDARAEVSILQSWL